MTSRGGTGREVFIVVDLGFGDAGKGSITDALVRLKEAHTVVRFNGGAQAGHNVVTADGRHHTFAQLGSGTFVPGVRTHLSRHVVVHPAALLVEVGYLEARGVRDALDRLSISESALVTTPIHQAAIRLRELARGSSRHGSCGVGVGETARDAIASPETAIVARDLLDTARLRARLLDQQASKRGELEAEVRAVRGMPAAAPETRVLEDPAVVDAWIDGLAPLRRHRGLVVSDRALGDMLRQPGAVVFEGAQGVLLDEWRGFHPHTTWSTCTFANAVELLREAGADVEGSVTRLGVLRTYAVRHGPGPMPTEVSEDMAWPDEPHNAAGPWQGSFRRGWLDLVLARYAIEVCGGVDGLALTHLDALPRLPRVRVCTGYRVRDPDERLFVRAPGTSDEVRALRPGKPRDLDHAAALGRALSQVTPIYEELAGATESLPARLEEALGARVLVRSSGPTAGDKTFAMGPSLPAGGPRAPRA